MSQQTLFEDLLPTCPDDVPCGQRGLIRANNNRPYCICCGRATDGKRDDGWMSRELAFRFKVQLLRQNRTKKEGSND